MLSLSWALLWASDVVGWPIQVKCTLRIQRERVFVLAAKNNGWDSLILGIRDAEKIKAIMGIPDDEVVTSVIALGRAAGATAKPPRKPVGEVVKVL